jgi:hypothetical protein
VGHVRRSARPRRRRGLPLPQGRPSRDTIRLLAPDADYDAEAAAVEHAEVHDTNGVFALPGAEQLLRPVARSRS